MVEYVSNKLNAVNLKSFNIIKGMNEQNISHVIVDMNLMVGNVTGTTKMEQ